jgi:hypothetical protein
MEIKEIAVEEILPAAYNPRKDLKPSDAEYQKIKLSITQFGFIEPLIWNKRSGNLVGGHQRFKVLMESNPKTLPCVVVDYDEANEKAANVALNKISGEWDFPKLKELLVGLDDGSFNLHLSGFDETELKGLIDFIPDQSKQFAALDKELAGMGDYDEVKIEIVIQKRYYARALKFLAQGEKESPVGLGLGLVRILGVKQDKGFGKRGKKKKGAKP